jgi:hypothetical protein
MTSMSIATASGSSSSSSITALAVWRRFSGNAAYYYAPAGAADANTYQTVTMDLTDALPNTVAGMFVSVPADLEYCWIQTWGYATLNTTLASGADGGVLGATGSGGTDGVFTQCETTSSATAIKQPCGIIIDASAKLVFLKCE